MPVHPAHQPGYSYHLHRRHEDDYRPEERGPRTGASGLVVCKEHSGTHIDALSHQSDRLVLYGGVPVTPDVQTSRGFRTHGVEEIPPLVAPGWLLDFPAFFDVEALAPGYAITLDDFLSCADRQGITLAAGDVVLVRTGNEGNWAEPERYLAGPGIGAEVSRWLAEQKVLAVGADNMAWDVIGLHDPVLNCELPGHLILLAQSGVYILENLRLEELAAARPSRFLFVCAPLKLVGATGSPVRPLALVTCEAD